MKTNTSLITGMMLIAMFITTMIVPLISATTIGMDKMNQMNRLTRTVDYGFELDK